MPAAQMAHLVLPDTQADPSQNQKSHFLPTHQGRLFDLKTLLWTININVITDNNK